MRHHIHAGTWQCNMQRKLASIRRPSCSHATFTICKRNKHVTSVYLAYTQRVRSAYLARLRLIMAAVVDRPRAAHVCAAPGTGARPSHICIGTRDHPCPHLRRAWAHPSHICSGTDWAHHAVRARRYVASCALKISVLQLAQHRAFRPCGIAATSTCSGARRAR